MEDVLAVYMRAHDPDRPLVCLDETSKQLIGETRVPIPMKRGRPARFDYEYERNGTANLFMMFAPLEGWRHVKVTDRHTAVDYAHVLKDLADIHFPNAETIVLVQDNLNIHSKASLYEAFPCRRGKAAGGALRMALHPQAWQLARSGGVRAGGPIVSMPRPPHPRQANPNRRNRRLGARSKCQTHQCQLALHNRQRTHQTQAPVPVNLTESGD
jgi:hypothetical protein